MAVFAGTVTKFRRLVLLEETLKFGDGFHLCALSFCISRSENETYQDYEISHLSCNGMLNLMFTRHFDEICCILLGRKERVFSMISNPWMFLYSSVSFGLSRTRE